MLQQSILNVLTVKDSAQYLSLAMIPTDEMVRNTKDEFPCLTAAMEFYFEFLLSTSTMEFH